MEHNWNKCMKIYSRYYKGAEIYYWSWLPRKMPSDEYTIIFIWLWFQIIID